MKDDAAGDKLEPRHHLLVALARHVSSGHSNIAAEFATADKDGSALLSFEELLAVFHRIGVEVAEDDAEWEDLVQAPQSEWEPSLDCDPCSKRL